MFKPTILLYFFVMAYSAAPAQTAVCDLWGTIRAGDALVGGAVVELLETKHRTTTNAEGQFLFANLQCDSYSLFVYAEGHQTLIQVVALTPSSPHFNFDLVSNQNLLAAAEVTTNSLENSFLQKTLGTKTVTRAYLDGQASQNFVGGLEKIAGINAIQTGVGIAKPMIRGMAFNRVQVNDRGIKQEGQQWGADHGLEIDPYDVNGVEIVKGPASIIYGGDAMGGVINILPQPLQPADTFTIQYVGLHHSNNQLLGHSLQAGLRKGAYWVRVRGSTQKFSDYRVNAQQFTYAGFVLPIFEERLKNTAGNERHGSISAGYVGKRHQSTLTLSAFTQNAGLFTGAVGIPNRYNLQHRGDFANIELPSQQVAHYKALLNNVFQTKNGFVEADFGAQYNERNEYSRPHAHGYPVNFSDTRSLGLKLFTLTGNLRWHRNLGNGWKQILGIQTQYMENNHQGFEFLVPRFQSYQTGGFVFFENNLRQKWWLNAAVRVDGVRHNIQKHLQPVFANGHFTGTEEIRNPDILRNFGNMSGAVGARFQPSKPHQWKFNLGSSFRMPTAIELSMNGVHHGNFRHEVGTANLSTERGYQLDVNYQWSTNTWQIAVSGFGSFYNQYIYLAPQPRFSPLPGAGAFWQYQQNDALFGGFELEVQKQLGSHFHFSSATDYVQNKNLQTGLPLPLTPPLISRNRLTFKQPFGASNNWRLELYLETTNAAPQNRTDRNERTTPGYTLLEAGMVVQASRFVKFYVAGQNLTNRAYFNHLSRYRLLNLPEPGRNIMLRVVVDGGWKMNKNFNNQIN